MTVSELCLLVITFWVLKSSAFIIRQNSTKFYCAKNWRLYDNKTCLIYVNQPKSFRNARRDCRLKNGDLVMLESREKMNFVVDQLLGIEAWIGLRSSLLRSNRLVWNINPQQSIPNYLDSKIEYGCVYLKPIGRWQVTHKCSERRPYICEARVCQSEKSCSHYNVNGRRRRSKGNRDDREGFSQIRVLPSVKDEEKAISSHNWSITTEGPLLYLNPVTCSLFIILLAVFLSLYVVFIKSLKRSIEQIKEDLDRRHDRTRFMDGSVYCSLPFNTQT